MSTDGSIEKDDMVLPDLPTEIIVLVGQFLAGNHAFGTLAALHTTSHALKEETTPILYETLFLDNKDNMPFYFQDAGVEKKMIKYAKFCFCHDYANKHQHHLERLTNLIATIETHSVIESGDHAGVHRFSVFLHKPIKTATLFGTITETPAYARSSWNRYLKGPLGRLRELYSLQLQGKEAYLIADNPSEPLWTTSIHLHDTIFCPRFAEDRVEREFNTLFELLRLTRRDRVRDAEHDLHIDRRHLMTLVREEDCGDLLARFDEQARIHPEIFLNRMEIRVRVHDRSLARYATVFESVINNLLRTYTKYATSMAQLPLGNIPFIIVDFDDWPNMENPTDERIRLFELARSMSPCGKPSNFFNPAMTERPLEDYIRTR